MHSSPEVAQALAQGQPVVALESTVITHGLPRPLNLELAHSLESQVRQAGAVPATIGLINGEVWIGLNPTQLEQLAHDSEADKASLWNMAAILAQGRSAGTTVATTAYLAHKAGIKVFATGGIGGVHQGAPFDESADLGLLAKVPMLVVCAGAKSILDLPATLERLESYGVGLVGYRTSVLPAFHSPQSPYLLPARAESPAEVAQILVQSLKWGLGGMLVLNPVSQGLPFDQVAAWVDQANQEAREVGVGGKALTPFLLRRISQLSGGLTDQVNLRLLNENAALAAHIAKAYTSMAQAG